MLHLLMQGPNILMDDTLSSEGVDKSLLNAVKDSIVQVPITWHAPTHMCPGRRAADVSCTTLFVLIVRSAVRSACSGP